MSIKLVPNYQLFKMLAAKSFPDKRPKGTDLNEFEIKALNIRSSMAGQGPITREIVDETVSGINSGDGLYRTIFLAARRSLVRGSEIEISKKFGRRESVEINLFKMLGLYFCGVYNGQIYVSRNKGDIPKVTEDDESIAVLRTESKPQRSEIGTPTEVDGFIVYGESGGEIIVFQKGSAFKKTTVMLNFTGPTLKDSLYTPLPIPVTLA